MWFSFPEGCSSISVERQEFFAEVTDDAGVTYFRAPDHFAPRILEFKGFFIADPKNLPPDLPQEDPLRDGAIASLTMTVEAQKLEIQNMRSDLSAASARVVALMNEKTDLAKTLEDRERTIQELTERLEDKQ